MLIQLLLLASPAVPPVPSAAAHTDPPIHVSFNDNGKYDYGDKAKVYVESAQDGYLVVLRSDAKGDVRVLSPLDPDDDQQIHGGKKYEAKGRGGREAFVAEDTSGQGVVLAAWSKTPFDLQRYAHDAHWDYQTLDGSHSGLSTPADDPEARLLSLVDAMKPGGHFDYDAATYVVYSPSVARAHFVYPYPYGWYGGWWGYDPWWGAPVFGPRVVFVPGRFGFRRFR